MERPSANEGIFIGQVFDRVSEDFESPPLPLWNDAGTQSRFARWTARRGAEPGVRRAGRG